MRTATAIAAGAALAFGYDALIARVRPAQRLTIHAGWLIGAAAVYPLARARGHTGDHGRAELAGLAAYGSVGLLAARAQPRVAAPVIAAGWASHAVFDMAHDTGPDSRVPGWYPAACAGYDLALAARLVTSGR